MKPYILNYSESMHLRKRIKNDAAKVPIDYFSLHNFQDSTLKTASIEPADHDEIQVFSSVEMRPTKSAHGETSTLVTESVEPADNDEIHLDSTLITRAVETSDEDSIYLDGGSIGGQIKSSGLTAYLGQDKRGCQNFCV